MPRPDQGRTSIGLSDHLCAGLAAHMRPMVSMVPTAIARKTFAQTHYGLRSSPSIGGRSARPGELNPDHPGELDGGGVLLFSENSPGRIGMTAIAKQSYFFEITSASLRFRSGSRSESRHPSDQKGLGKESISIHAFEYVDGADFPARPATAHSSLRVQPNLNQSSGTVSTTYRQRQTKIVIRSRVESVLVNCHQLHSWLSSSTPYQRGPSPHSVEVQGAR